MCLKKILQKSHHFQKVFLNQFVNQKPQHSIHPHIYSDLHHNLCVDYVPLIRFCESRGQQLLFVLVPLPALVLRLCREGTQPNKHLLN